MNNIFPKTPWNYALLLDTDNLPKAYKKTVRNWPKDNFPFTLDAVLFTFTVEARRIPSWGMDATGMTDVLPASTAQRAKETEAITLVPMGAARLRIAAFPCTSE